MAAIAIKMMYLHYESPLECSIKICNKIVPYVNHFWLTHVLAKNSLKVKLKGKTVHIKIKNTDWRLFM